MRFRKNLHVLVIALVVGMVVAAGPVTAAIYDAMNAHKVDGKHAVGAGASSSRRADNLVATDSSGRLPNNIIRKAPDANRLDGKDSSAFVGRAGIFEVPYFGPWLPGDPSSTPASASATSTEVTKSSLGQSNVQGVPPQIPASMFGKKVRVIAFELCYNATDPDVVITEFNVQGLHQTTWGSAQGDYLVYDDDDYDDSTCRMFTAASTDATGDGPVLLGRNGYVQPSIQLQWLNDGGSFTITKSTWFFKLSNVASGNPT